MLSYIKTGVSNIFRLFVGIVIVVSAVAKATDTAVFADLLGKYGFLGLGYLAPAIILAELLLGLLLVFDIKPRAVAAITIGLIGAFSAVFAYGLIHLGIRDCGCFGPLSILNNTPWFTLTRNGLLIALLIPTILLPETKAKPTQGTITFIAVIISAVMFLCGFTFRGAECLQREKTSFAPTAISDQLQEIAGCHPDSSYLIYAFSYECPFCLNSVGNVNQYVTMHAVDRVMGIAVADEEAAERFYRLFDIEFPIQEISDIRMLRLTGTLPTAWLIRGDSVRAIFHGQVPSPALLNH